MSRYVDLITALRARGLGLLDVFPVIRDVLGSPDKGERDATISSLLSRGDDATQEEIDIINTANEHCDETDALITNLLFLGFLTPPVRADDKNRDKRYDVILWLIRNHPQSHVHQTVYVYLNATHDTKAYLESKELWLNAVRDNPEDLRILENAIRFTGFHDHEICLDLIDKYYELEPDSEKWTKLLEDIQKLQDKKLEEDEE